MSQSLIPAEAGTQTADPAQTALQRAAVYAGIASAFYDPSPDLAARLTDGTYAAEIARPIEELASSGLVSDALRSAINALHASLAPVTGQDAEALLHELKVEYARLFIGPGFPVVSPYETIHAARDGDKSAALMVSPQALNAEAAYRDAGLALASDQRQPPDHFSTEVEFMYYLCVKQAEAIMAADATADSWRYRQDAFLERHLGQWSSKFCRQVEDNAHHPFYAAIARVTGAWIEYECAGRAQVA